MDLSQRTSDGNLGSQEEIGRPPKEQLKDDLQTIVDELCCPVCYRLHTWSD